jgi:hypothetical protein
MRQTITVSSLNELRQFKKEFVQLIDVVKAADGKYVLYVDTRRDNSPATRSMFITKRQLDEALSPEMRSGSPSAFSPNIAGGRFLPHRLDAAYSAYLRAQARADITDTVPGSALIRNTQQYLAVYGEQFGYYPPGRMGDALNAATTAALRK